MTRSSSILSALFALSLCGLGCDPTLPTESKQLAIDPGLEFFNRYAAPVAVVEGSVACFTYLGYRSGDDTNPVVETDHEELRACYTEALSGPARFDEASCIAFEAPGAVRWDATRVSCPLGPEDLVGDDAARFEVLRPEDVQAVFNLAIPPELYLVEGATLQLEGLEQLSVPEGIVAEPGEPVWVIEGGIDRLGVGMLDTAQTRVVATSDPVVVAAVAEGSAGRPEVEGGMTSVSFVGAAGDVVDVALDTPAGRFEVGEIHIVSADEVDSISVHPRVVREAGTDGFVALGAHAVARDDGGRILRGPAVAWEVLDGAFEISAGGEGAAEGPEVSVADPCSGATASTADRSVLLEARFGDLRETVRVAWTCVQLEDEGCACQANQGNAARDRGGLLGLLVFGFALRPRRRRRGIASR